MFSFKRLFLPTGPKAHVTAYEAWVVRWAGRYGDSSYQLQDEVEIFPFGYLIAITNVHLAIRHMFLAGEGRPCAEAGDRPAFGGNNIIS